MDISIYLSIYLNIYNVHISLSIYGADGVEQRPHLPEVAHANHHPLQPGGNFYRYMHLSVSLSTSVYISVSISVRCSGQPSF